MYSLSASVFLCTRDPRFISMLWARETNGTVQWMIPNCTQASITCEGGARGPWLMLCVITDGYPQDEMIYKWRRNSVQAADQKSWRLYQFDFMGLRNTTDIIKTTAGNCFLLLFCLDLLRIWLCISRWRRGWIKE